MEVTSPRLKFAIRQRMISFASGVYVLELSL